MKNWKEYKDEHEVPDYKDAPKRKNLWRAYKDGKSFGPFDDKDVAQKISHLVESYTDPEQDKIWNAWWADSRAREQKALDEWYADLRAEYSDLSDDVFQIAYTEAHDRGHHAGNDEIAGCLTGTAEFARNIIKAISKSE